LRLIKLLIYSLVFFLGLIFLFSLLFPSDIRISKTINMKADQQTVLTYLENLDHWRSWNPTMQQIADNEFSVLDSLNGKVSSMKINNTTVKIKELKADEILIEYSRPGKNNVNSVIHTIQYPQSDSMAVQWYMDFKLKWYPWEKFSSLLFEKMYGDQMKQGLENLKQLHENNLQ
jgi:hypothetical protein